MSVQGHSRRFRRPPTTSGLPLQADIIRVCLHVSKVPFSEVNPLIRSPRRQATARLEHGNAEPVCSLEITTKVNLLACGIGRSPGLEPARIFAIATRLAKSVHQVT